MWTVKTGKYPIINEFDTVNKLITNSTLLVLDIDDTVLDLKKLGDNWWDNTLRKYYFQYEDIERARLLTLRDWEEQAFQNGSAHTHDSIYNINHDKIIFLTAREKTTKDITYKQLTDIKLNQYIVYFCGRNPKGEVLKEILLTHSGVNHVIFVDDVEMNLDSVKKELANFNIRLDLYQFRQTPKIG